MSWPLVKLDDICNFVRGPFGGALKKECFVDTGYAVYEQQHAIYNQFKEIRYFVDENKFQDLKRFELYPGDLIMSCSGTMGKIAIVPDGISKGIINQALLKLTPNEKVDINFLKYWLESESFQFMLNGSTHGAAIKNVASVAVLKNLEIPLPPLTEQKRIAAILDKADAIRRKRQQAIQLADEFLRAVFLDMFGDPVTNPKGWEVKPLIDLIEHDRPITYGILKPGEDIENGVPYIRVVDMKDGVVLSGQVRRTTHEIAQQYKRSTLKNGDVLLSIRGHVGRLAIVPPELEGANITQDTARLSTNSMCRSLYLYACLQTKSMQNEMMRYVRGAAVKGINLGDVKQLRIPVPPKALQEKIERKIQLMSSTIEKNEISKNLLEAQFGSLGQKAFSGKL